MPTKRMFDLIVIVGLGLHLAVGLPKMWARRTIATTGTTGLSGTVASATQIVLGR